MWMAGTRTTRSAGSKGEAMTWAFFADVRGSAARSSGVKRLLSDDVAAEQAADGHEGDAHGPGRETGDHGEVAVILPLDLAPLDGPPPARADGVEGLVGLVGQLDPLDAAGADEDVPVAAGRMAEQVEVPPLQADELVDEGHRMALGGEAAEGERRSVRDERRRLVEVRSAFRASPASLRYLYIPAFPKNQSAAPVPVDLGTADGLGL